MGTINCLGISIKIKKILACLFWAIFGVCLLTIPTFAAENIGGEPVDRSGTVTYISIPNGIEQIILIVYFKQFNIQ